MQNFGQPPAGPPEGPLDGLFFEDPFEAMADAFDNPAGLPSMNGGGIAPPDPEDYMDDLPRERDVLGESFNGTTLPPPELDEPPITPEPSQPVMQGYVSEGPPLPPEPAEHQWINLKPPPAARPYFTADGLKPASYRPSGRAGSGTKSGSSSHSDEVHCPVEDDWVPQQKCEDCEYYDADAGVCSHHNREEES